MYYDVILSGFGGQGILLIGDLLAHAAMLEGLHVTWMPSYGVEMRGGAANCTVVISSEKIGSPITDEPCGLIAMSNPSLLKFQGKVKKEGLMVVNTSLVDSQLIERGDLGTVPLPANEIAYQEVGEHKMANIVMLGAFLAGSGVVSMEKVEETVDSFFEGGKRKNIPLMVKALRRGFQHQKEGMEHAG